jgi:aspartate-semialdehyde dehydrogenase
MDAQVPLVVPEVNGDSAGDHAGILANPNCSTILLVLALAPLHRAAGLRRVVVSTYQAASGAGQRAVEELREGTRAALDGRAFTPEALPHDLAFNVFPQVDAFEPSGYTREEDKLLHETRRILDLPDLAVDATCVRVPVERSHSESVTVELERALSPDEARAILSDAPGIEVIDDPVACRYPQPIRMSGRESVAVGRIRASRAFPGGLSFWLAGDQLRKGAALNAVQIAERLINTPSRPQSSSGRTQ